jgi:hypothetical protein
MELAGMLNHLYERTEPVDSSCAYLFVGKEYPLLFFSYFIPYYVHTHHLRLYRIEDININELSLIAESSFLGSRQLIWIGNLSDIDARALSPLLDWLSLYQGPNIIMGWLPEAYEKRLKNIQKIIIPDITDGSFIHSLSILISSSKKIPSAIIERYKTLTLDKACMLLHYGCLYEGSSRDTFYDFLDLLIKGEESLFTLSQYFFAQKPSYFYTLWIVLQHKYSTAFWISFWSDQLWNAYQYIEQVSEKKSIFHSSHWRLPFSFLKYDWKRYTLLELSQAHQQIYTIDYAFKNGRTFPFFDHFLAQFFSGAYRCNSLK